MFSVKYEPVKGNGDNSDHEVRHLIQKNAIFQVKDKFPGFIGSLFVINKISGGFWSIVNLKNLNNFVKYERFQETKSWFH